MPARYELEVYLVDRTARPFFEAQSDSPFVGFGVGHWLEHSTISTPFTVSSQSGLRVTEVFHEFSDVDDSFLTQKIVLHVEVARLP